MVSHLYTLSPHIRGRRVPSTEQSRPKDEPAASAQASGLTQGKQNHCSVDEPQELQNRTPGLRATPHCEQKARF